ncbi:response regulator [Rhodoferax sp. PAMC 29310]|uniref:response regulator n=1 Tax=Rhodoferax sp. PAMC 29310 TaxID=2822760 RepID=UPI001B31FE13|nr:response regulator [Rhodoferax sp. PAMC 29310]
MVVPPDQAAWAGLRVLVIEDDALGGLLTTWGCQVIVAGDAAEALALWAQGMRPEFIVSDYRLLGDFNGVDTVLKLRQLAGTPIAACVVSGDRDDAVRHAAMEAGLILLTKPVRPAKLRSMMRHLTRTQATQPQLSDEQPAWA